MCAQHRDLGIEGESDGMVGLVNIIGVQIECMNVTDSKCQL